MLEWKKLGPTVKEFRELIQEEVAADTRKLTSTEAFKKAISDDSPANAGGIREFAEKRSKFLLEHKAIKDLPEKMVELAPVTKKKKDDSKEK